MVAAAGLHTLLNRDEERTTRRNPNPQISLAALAAMFKVPLPRAKRSTPKTRAQWFRGFARSLGHPSVALLGLANLFFMGGLSVIMTLFPVAGASEIEGGLTVVGVALTTAGISGFVLGPLAGRMSDKVGRAPLMFLGAVVAASEGAALVFSRSPLIICAGFFLGGIGVAAFVNAVYASLGDLARRRDRGTVTGAVGLAGEAGGILGSMAAALLWSTADISAVFGLQPVFALMAVGPIALLWRGKMLRPRRRPQVSESLIPG